jgi:hypothetical protein
MLAFIGIGPAGLIAQSVSVSAEIDPNPAAVGDQVSLTIQVASADGTVEQPQLPKIQGLKLLGGPSVSKQFQWVNGQASSSQSLTYYLQPEQEGSFKIPAIAVRVAGKAYQTQELAFRVVKASAANSPIGKRQGIAGGLFDEEDSFFNNAAPHGEVLVVAGLDKKNVFVGEQLVLTYKLLTQLPVASVEIKDAPSLKGFWAEEMELPKGAPPRKRTVNGKSFVEYDIKKQALFANSTGLLEIPAYTFGLVVRIGGGGFFSFESEQRIVRKTDPLSVKVEPLPVEGKPAGFSGAVGTFQLETALDRDHVAAGEALNLSVTLSGNGNLKTLGDFPLPDLPGFKLFSSKSQETMRVEQLGLRESKTWQYVLLGQAPGKERLPELNFSFFSPQTRQYQTIHSKPLDVTVIPGGSTMASAGLSTGVSQQELQRRGSDINYIHLGTAGLGVQQRWLYQSLGLYLVMALPFFLNAGLLSRRYRQARVQRDVLGYRSRHAVKLAEKKLAEARQCLQKNQLSQFHERLESSVTRYLGEKFNLPQIEITSQQIRHYFEENGNQQLGCEVADLLEACNFARYAPVPLASSRLEALFDRARQTLVQVERETGRK